MAPTASGVAMTGASAPAADAAATSAATVPAARSFTFIVASYGRWCDPRDRRRRLFAGGYRRLCAGLARRDVLVEPEHVVRVVLRLQRDEPLVLRPEARADGVAVVVAHEVEVDAARRPRLHRGGDRPRPRNVPFVVGGILPDREIGRAHV